MTYLSIHDIRNENIRFLIANRFEGNATTMAAACQIRRGVLHKANAKTEASHRGIGTRIARKIEQCLNLDLGWIDTPRPIEGTLLAKLQKLDRKQLQTVGLELGLNVSYPLIASMTASARRRANVKMALANLGISATELARRSGIIQSSLARSLAPNYGGEFSRALCDRIEAALGVEPFWLDHPHFREGDVGFIATNRRPKALADRLEEACNQRLN